MNKNVIIEWYPTELKIDLHLLWRLLQNSWDIRFIILCLQLRTNFKATPTSLTTVFASLSTLTVLNPGVDIKCHQYQQYYQTLNSPVNHSIKLLQEIFLYIQLPYETSSATTFPIAEGSYEYYSPASPFTTSADGLTQVTDTFTITFYQYNIKGTSSLSIITVDLSSNLPLIMAFESSKITHTYFPFNSTDSASTSLDAEPPPIISLTSTGSISAIKFYPSNITDNLPP